MLWTIGHSTRPLDSFLEVLEAHRIELVVDVRRFPGSRRHPQYASEPLAAALAGRGMEYHWLPELGGRRRLPATMREAGAATGWRHPAFQAYAIHTLSEEFAQGLLTLLSAAEAVRTAVMCAELLSWRCHRRIIAEVVESLGVPVTHIGRG